MDEGIFEEMSYICLWNSDYFDFDVGKGLFQKYFLIISYGRKDNDCVTIFVLIWSSKPEIRNRIPST